MNRNGNISVVVVTVFAGFVGLSLPFPVFGHLFLNPAGALVPADASSETRVFLLGFAIALFPIGQALAAPVWGGWSDRCGRKRALLASLVPAAVGMLLVAIAIQRDWLALLLIGRFVSGLGEANITIAQAIAADVPRESDRSRNFALISIAMNAGWILGPLLGGALGDPAWSDWTGYRLPFWFATGMYCVNFLIVAIGLREIRRPASEQSKTSSATGAFSIRDLSAVLLLTIAAFFGTYVMFSFFAPYLIQVFAATPLELGVYSALLSVPLIATGLLSQRIHERLRTSRTAALGLLLMGAGLASIPLADTRMALILPACAAAAGIVLLEVSTAVMVAAAAPREAYGRAMGIYRSVIVVAEILAALSGGWLAGITPATPFIVAAGVVLCALPLCVKTIAGRPNRANVGDGSGDAGDGRPMDREPGVSLERTPVAD